MQDDFKNRMRRHPLAPKRPLTLAVPDPDKPVAESQWPNPAPPPFPDHVTVRQPAFEIPLEGEAVTLDSLVALSKNGGNVPMPVARDITEKEMSAIQAGQAPSMHLTKLERDTLTKLGWHEGEPIPPDLSVELQRAFSDYVAQQQARGIPLEQIKISRIEDLPESEQIRMKAVMRTMIEKEKTQLAADAVATARAEQLAAYPDSVKQALNGVDLSPDIVPASLPGQERERGGPPTTFPEAVKQVPADEIEPAIPEPRQGMSSITGPQADTATDKREMPITTCSTCGRDPFREKQRLVCTHCACDPLEDPDAEKISLDDKRRFLIALGSKRPFEKEYKIFNETIEVRFRTLRAREFEDLSLWAIRTVAREKILLPDEMMPRVRYMELLGGVVLQTRFLRSSIEGAELFWAAPETPYPTFGDWGVGSMDELVAHFMEEVPSESVIVALQHHLTRFNQLDFRMSREANNTTNFWMET